MAIVMRKAMTSMNAQKDIMMETMAIVIHWTETTAINVQMVMAMAKTVFATRNAAKDFIALMVPGATMVNA
jgi:hypothetical protein